MVGIREGVCPWPAKELIFDGVMRWSTNRCYPLWSDYIWQPGDKARRHSIGTSWVRSSVFFHIVAGLQQRSREFGRSGENSQHVWLISHYHVYFIHQSAKDYLTINVSVLWIFPVRRQDPGSMVKNVPDPDPLA
jgi:hypothetical protein